MEQSGIFCSLSLNLVYETLSTWAVKTRLDHILCVVVAGGEVHIHETVVDAKVLDMEEMMISMEVAPVIVSWFLCVSKLIIDAVL